MTQKYKSVPEQKPELLENAQLESIKAGLIGRFIGTGKQAEMIIMFVLTIILLIIYISINLDSPKEEKLFNLLMLGFGYFAGRMNKH